MTVRHIVSTPVRRCLIVTLFVFGSAVSSSYPGEGEFAAIPFDELTLAPVTFESIWTKSCHGKLLDDERRKLQMEIKRLRFTSRTRQFEWAFVRAAVRVDGTSYYFDASGNVMTPAGEFSTAISESTRSRIKSMFDDLRVRLCGAARN